MRLFYVYDVRRNRRAHELDCDEPELARAEFCAWYNIMIRPERWEQRSLGRYFLYEVVRDAEGNRVAVPFLMSDEDVRADREYFRMCDPPHDAAAVAVFEADFARLDAIDLARLKARGNDRLEFFNGRSIEFLVGDAGGEGEGAAGGVAR